MWPSTEEHLALVPQRLRDLAGVLQEGPDHRTDRAPLQQDDPHGPWTRRNIDRQALEREIYVFIHPLPRVIAWRQMHADDLGRMLGWEFSLMVATVRLINSGLLDELPSLRIHVSHFAGCIGRFLPRIRGLQNRERNGTAALPLHGRQPKLPFDHYLHRRLFYDCCGWSSYDNAAKEGSAWVQAGLTELPAARTVFATDYPQGVQDDDEVAAYVTAVRALGGDAVSVLEGATAEKLIPDLGHRLAARMA